MQQPVGKDFFDAFSWPMGLKAGPGGGLAWLQKTANIQKDCYEKSLWILHMGAPLCLAEGEDIEGHWWRGEVLVFAAKRRAEDKERAEKGFPLTVLHTLSTRLPGAPREWLRLDYNVSDIAFLPDGRFLFTAEYDPAREALLAGAVNEEEAAAALKSAARVEVFTELPFWAEGEGYTSGKRQRLYLYDEGSVTPLTDTCTYVSQLRLAPGGGAAFFVANRYETVREQCDALYRLNTASLALEDISLQKLEHRSYAVCDDATLLVYGTDMREYGMNQNGRFYRYDLAEKAVQTLEDSGAYCGWNAVLTDLVFADEPVWTAAPDGVYWIDTLGHSSYLMRLSPNGEVTTVTKGEGAVMELALAGGQLYITAMRGMEGPELYSVAPDGSQTCITDLHLALAQQYQLQVPQPLQFTGSEGTPLKGWVIPPVGLAAGEGCGAVLMVHGGPKTVYGSGLNHEMQYLAAEGFAVLYCNPTGSDGRGDAFADIRGRWGTVDYEDLLAFVDAALEAHPYIDPARLAVSGGSYGGFMTNWIITHTNRFAAAVSQRGIANWPAMQGMSDIGYFFAPDQTGENLLEDAAALWAQSPLNHVGKVTTPTLFIHGEDDRRCPYGDTLQIYTALVQKGVDARFVLFHGEGHALATGGKPQSRMRRLDEVAAWLHKYLDV